MQATVCVMLYNSSQTEVYLTAQSCQHYVCVSNSLSFGSCQGVLLQPGNKATIYQDKLLSSYRNTRRLTEYWSVKWGEGICNSRHVEHSCGGPRILGYKHMHATVSRISQSTLKNNLHSVSCITKLPSQYAHVGNLLSSSCITYSLLAGWQKTGCKSLRRSIPTEETYM